MTKTIYIIMLTTFFIFICIFCDNNNDIQQPSANLMTSEVQNVIGTLYINADTTTEEETLELVLFSGSLSGPHYQIEIIGNKKQELMNNTLKWIKADGIFYLPVESSSNYDPADMVSYGLVQQFDIKDYTITAECRTVEIQKQVNDYYLIDDSVDYIIDWNNSTFSLSNFEELYHIHLSEYDQSCLCGDYNYINDGQSFLIFGDWIFPFGYPPSSVLFSSCSEARLD